MCAVSVHGGARAGWKCLLLRQGGELQAEGGLERRKEEE